MDTIRNELRVGEDGEPEIWTNLGDVLTWLDSLPEETNNRIAAAVALEIRETLFNMVSDAELVQKPTPGAPWTATSDTERRFKSDPGER